MATTAATFRAGGLASGLDTNSIIDQLMTIEAQPMQLVQQRQVAVKTQISSLADITSKLSDLAMSGHNLATAGAVATTISSAAAGYDAVTGSGAVAGRHTIKVTALASAASGLSQQFDAATSPVNAGHIDFTVQGKDYGIDVATGSTLADVAYQIRQTGAPLSATLINDGTHTFLSLMDNETGNPTTGAALAVTDPSNVLGLTLKGATSAGLTVDGLPITRQSNSVGDVIPGVTINLKSLTTTDETLVISNDTSGTQANLQKFVDSYNSVIKLVQAQLTSPPGSDRSSSLAGDPAMRSLQNALHSLMTTKVNSASTATIRTLSDVGLSTDRDGTLSIDTTTLTKALSRDANAVNNLFSAATTGLGAVTQKTVDLYGNYVNGLLNTSSKGLQDNVKQMDDQLASMQLRLDNHKQQLIDQFTAMEQVVSGAKSTGNFLTQIGSSSGGTSK
jgi:flagellar hook-associated protein 2